MGRFGDFTAQFFARNNLNTPLVDGGGSVTTRVPVSGETTAVMNAAGRSSLVFGYDALIGPLIAEGNVVICYQYDALIDPPFVGGVPFCLPFLIETATPLEPGLVRVEGPDLLEELKNSQRFAPVGAGTVTSTTVATTAVADPVATTLTAGAPHNSDSVILASITGWAVGDEARITLDGGGVHVSVVKAINPTGTPANTVQLTTRLPADAASGNAASRRKRQVTVAASAAAFQVGVEVRLTLDDSTVHTTVAAEEPEGNVITMRDGAPDGAAIGKAIQATDYSQPTTTDVTQIMSYLGNWDVEFESGGYTGTAAGTHHAPNGDSLYDLMIATAKRTGEFFRLKTPGVSAAPERTVIWRRTFDYAGQGGNLRLVQPTQANIDSEAANVNRGIITGDVQRDGVFQPVTRVIPFAGDKRITLALCSETARLQAAVEGLTLVDTGLGLYTPPYLYNAAAEATALGMIARTVTFSDIRVETDNALEWQSAADALMRAAIAYLYEHGTGVRYRYTVPDIVAAPPVYPGQRVEMVYTSADGRWSVNAVAGSALYVLEVNSRFDPPEETTDGNLNDRGKLTTLTLVASPWDIPDLATTVANAVADISRIARLDGGGAGGATVITGGGGGSGGDHGGLTGLADDDHPQYLRTDGTRVMTGSLQLNAGLLVDGVDLTAHVANPAAHHNPVTAGDASMSVAGGQVIAVGSGIAGAGLTLSGGVLEVNTLAGLGTQIVGDAVTVKTATGGGLGFGADGVMILLAVNSGLTLAGNTLAVGTPSTLTATTTNAVTGSSHTHAITASADVSSAAGNTLLKSGAAGELAVARLGVGAATTTLAAGFFQAQATDDYTLFLKQRTGQTAELWRVEDAAGNPLIRLTGGGDLESGTPAFVSRVTGWQIEAGGSAEFNNVFIRGELHAATFVADEMHATGGTLAVMTAAKVSVPVSAGQNVLPAVGSTFTLNVQASWDTGLCYFSGDDVIRIKPMGEIASGGSLDLYDIYLQVIAPGTIQSRNLANGNAGYYPMTCRRLNGGATGFEIPAGNAAVKWGKIGGSGFTGVMFLTSDLPASPYLDIATVDATQSAATWQSAPVTPIPRVRVGNLRGVLGKSADEWGIAAGTDLSNATTAARFIVASNAGLELRNIDAKLYTGGEVVVALIQGASPYIAAGTPSIPTGPAAGGAGFWAGVSGGVGQVRVGAASGTQMLYDGTSLTLASGTSGGRISFNPTAQSIALGSPLPTGTQTGGDGFWVGAISGGYALRIGGALNVGPQLLYDTVSGRFALRRTNGGEVITLDGNGDAYISGALTVGASGGIWQGSGSFASPTTGLKLYNVSGIGRLATYSGGTIQTAMDTDGAFKAGWDGSAWNVKLNSGGVELIGGSITADDGYVLDTVKRVTWTYSGAVTGWVAGRYISTTGATGIEMIAGPAVSGAGAQFNYKAGVAQTSYIRATGQLRLFGPSGVQAYGGLAVFDGATSFEHSAAAGESLYATNGVIVGGGPLGAAENAPGVLTLYRRTSHPSNPASGATALYIYYNTGTGKQELTMRNASGATVKVAEINAA